MARPRAGKGKWRRAGQMTDMLVEAAAYRQRHDPGDGRSSWRAAVLAARITAVLWLLSAAELFVYDLVAGAAATAVAAVALIAIAEVQFGRREDSPKRIRFWIDVLPQAPNTGAGRIAVALMLASLGSIVLIAVLSPFGGYTYALIGGATLSAAAIPFLLIASVARMLQTEMPAIREAIERERAAGGPEGGADGPQ